MRRCIVTSAHSREDNSKYAELFLGWFHEWGTASGTTMGILEDKEGRVYLAETKGIKFVEEEK